MTDEEMILEALSGDEGEEFRALSDRMREIAPEDSDIYRELERESLSDEEKTIVERYLELKELAMERLDLGDKL